MGRKMRLIPVKAERVTPEERNRLVELRQRAVDAEKATHEAVIRQGEAKTEFDYEVMQVRRRYNLKAGDLIDDKTGAITRA